MKTFVSQLATGFGILFAWVLLNDFIVQPTLVKMTASKSKPFNQVILGDSHGTRLWLDSSLSIAQDGDPILVQTISFNALLPHLPPLKRVILSVGPQNFSSLSHHKINSNKNRYLVGNSSRLAVISNLFGIAPSKEFWLHQFSGELHWPSSLTARDSPIELNNSSDLTQRNLEFRLDKHDVVRPDWFFESNSSTIALEEFVQLIHNADSLKLWMIGTPLHWSYRARLGKQGWRDYHDFLTRIAEKAGVHYISLEECPLPDSCFFDPDHLNAYGTAWLSDTLSTMIY